MLFINLAIGAVFLSNFLAYADERNGAKVEALKKFAAGIAAKLIPVQDELVNQLTQFIRDIVSQPNMEDVYRDLKSLEMSQVSQF